MSTVDTSTEHTFEESDNVEVNEFHPVTPEEVVCPTVTSIENNGTLKICVGMKFMSVNDAKKCYQDYGASQGFTIRIRSTYKNTPRSNETTGVRFVCSCEEKYWKSKHDIPDKGIVPRRTSHDRKGCVASMLIKKDDDGVFIVTRFTDQHNHELTSPTKRILMSSQRDMPQAAKDLLQAFEAEGIQLNKVVPMFGETSKLRFDKRSCWNAMRKARLYNEGGDAQSVKEYFKKMMLKDPGSYYAIQQDEEGRAINFFWIDGRSRNVYAVFGDVISFDTTYRTNKYKMQFAPFTGVNHNGQSILLGCALLENEVEETFVLVFERWLRAMGGKAPKSFLTDQDRAMSLALARVMPDTCHRYCIWHIKKKFGKKLGNIYFKNPSLKARHIMLQKPLWLVTPTYLSHGASHNVTEAIVASDFCRRTSQLSFMAARTEKGRVLFNGIIEKSYVELQVLDDEALMEGNEDVGDTQREGSEDVGDTQMEGNDDVCDTETQLDDNILLDPQVSQTKGRTRASCQSERNVGKDKRIKSGLEISQQDKKKQVRRCKMCNVQGHYASTCPGNK